jgi:putative NIF3 family GTP cyclohydrolase 1 type 2
MQTLEQIINVLETFAPLDFQEDYDNCGLVYGNPTKNIEKTIIALDLTQEVMDEAI